MYLKSPEGLKSDAEGIIRLVYLNLLYFYKFYISRSRKLDLIGTVGCNKSGRTLIKLSSFINSVSFVYMLLLSLTLT